MKKIIKMKNEGIKHGNTRQAIRGTSSSATNSANKLDICSKGAGVAWSVLGTCSTRHGKHGNNILYGLQTGKDAE
jgi:hypothetical protein